MKLWNPKPKTPGFGLAGDFYLSVLAATARLPAIVEALNPDGADGAVVGFGVPLGSGQGKEVLAQPLMRGGYALATKDRKTVLKLLVLSKEEAGYDPAPVVDSPLAATLDPEIVARLRATWTLLQFTFGSHDPAVYPSLDFLLDVAGRLGTLVEGVVADPIAETYRLPGELRWRPRLDPRVDAREHVVVRVVPQRMGFWAHTLGLRKFTIPEIEVYGVPPDLEGQVAAVLMAIAQGSLLGEVPRPGLGFGSAKNPLVAHLGGHDKGRWEGIPVLELLPERGSVGDAVRTAFDAS
ncbi:MAG: hypothetical protein KIS66_08200 [Fimbriimonadaceae bacterium]|nr:hypothetical protein [Fimbriimonadaceae bacterium]